MKSDSLAQFHSRRNPLLIILSGLSGAGKDEVLSRLKKTATPLKFVTTVTTRPLRHNEVQDVHYHFVTPAEFQRMIAHNELLEWANVYGNLYGVPRAPVKEALGSGSDVVVKVDVQGATTIKGVIPEGVFIFLTPASFENLELRLKERGTESAADLALRIQTATEELKSLSLFDYIVFNRQGEIDKAVLDIKSIIAAEKCRVRPRQVSL